MTSVTVTSYSKAMSILSEIGNGKCTDKCKSTSIRKIKYALKSVSNPLKLTRYTRRKLTQKIALVSGKNAVNEYSKTKKKYSERKSPPHPANKNCGKKMIGNDGAMYESKPNKNNVCSWKKI
jgi:hypothetical protein